MRGLLQSPAAPADTCRRRFSGMVKQRNQELVRAFLNGDGHLEVIVAGFCPNADQKEIAKQTADAIMRVIGEDAFRELLQLTAPPRRIH